MKKVVFLLAGILFLYSFCQAQTLKRVGYSGPQVSGVDFVNVADAVNSANAGDTIQLYQNSSLGSNMLINKRLVFIGFGYKLGNNPGLQAIPEVTNAVTLGFRAGSEYSKVMGVAGDIYIGADNIIISRCSGSVSLGYNGYTYINIINPVLTSCYFNSINGYFGTVSNALISNCICINPSFQNVSGLMSNNFIWNAGALGSLVVKNNIFYN
jgi:hypothetical protein